MSSIISKLFYSFLTLFGVVTIIFFLFNVLPVDPAQMMVDQQEDSQQLEQIKKNPYKRVDSENMTDIEKMDQGFNGKTFTINGIEIDF